MAKWPKPSESYLSTQRNHHWRHFIILFICPADSASLFPCFPTLHLDFNFFVKAVWKPAIPFVPLQACKSLKNTATTKIWYQIIYMSMEVSLCAKGSEEGQEQREPYWCSFYRVKNYWLGLCAYGKQLTWGMWIVHNGKQCSICSSVLCSQKNWEFTCPRWLPSSPANVTSTGCDQKSCTNRTTSRADEAVLLPRWSGRI